MKTPPNEKVATGGGESLVHNPFAALSKAGLPEQPVEPLKAGSGPQIQPTGQSSSQIGAGGGAEKGKGREEKRNRGRVDIVRETGGRGGKTVTVISGFVGIGLPEKEALAKKIRGACGCGGTVKDGQIEIQGDQRETVARILTEAGFRPVFAGG